MIEPDADLAAEFAEACSPDLVSLPNKRDEQQTVAALAGSIYAALHEIVGQNGTADIMVALGKRAKEFQFQRRGRPRGTRLDPALFDRYKQWPIDETRYAFARREAGPGASPSEVDKIRKRVKTLERAERRANTLERAERRPNTLEEAIKSWIERADK